LCSCGLHAAVWVRAALHLNMAMNVPVLQERGVKVKVKFTLEQATKARRGSRGIVLHSFLIAERLLFENSVIRSY
jgi:hypothetical protein